MFFHHQWICYPGKENWSRRMSTSTSFATSRLIALLLSPICPLFFCMMGVLPEMILKLCSMTSRSNHVIFVGCEAKTLEYFFRRVTNLTLTSSDRLAPIRIVCYGCPGRWCAFLVWWSSFDFFEDHTSSGMAMNWRQWCTRELEVTIVADLTRVLNLTIPWIVDGMACSWKSVGRPCKM